jgi:FAD/FMN-containing dehydrogenase
MSKVAHYLQEHVMGEVMTSVDARRYFSTDGSIFTVPPAVIMYPRNENDVRKTARFAWQLAERGRIIPITARGSGTDQAGAAIGSGIILAFPAHLNRIIELDTKTGVVVVEPGINYGKLQQTLETHGRFLPPFPASIEYSTIGGAVANNAAGEKSLKYGDTRAYVKALRVVLANGEVIETHRLNKRELNKKLGLATFEGEIYRALDALIEESQSVIGTTELNVTKNAAGYSLSGIKTKEGFDLTPLFVGSQGTLGIVTEVTLETEAHNSDTSLLAGFFDDVAKSQKAVLELRNLPSLPCAIEMVDDNLLRIVEKVNPNQLKDVIPMPLPRIVLLVEFDEANERVQKRLTKKARKILEKFATSMTEALSEEDKEKLWKIRHAAATVVAQSDSQAKAIPLIEDGVVPPEKYGEYVTRVQQLLQQQHVQAAVWGHAGDGNLHMQPLLDLAQVGDRQKAMRLMEEYYQIVIDLGGSTSGEHGDGRLRGPYLSKLYGAEAYGLFQKVKQIFDPYAILNPGVKVNVSLESIKPLMRHEYALGAWYDHLPHS